MAGEGLRDTELLDLVIATKPYLPPAQLGLPQQYTDLPIVNRQQSKGAKITGRDPEVRVKVIQSEKARMERLYQTKEYHKVDLLKKATSRWGHVTTDWIIDRREDLINKGAEQIVDVLATNKLDAVMDFAHLLEKLYMQTEKAEDDADLSLKGLPYWITPVPTHTITPGDGGFICKSSYDRDGTAITSVGGINATTYPLWANYGDTYTPPTSESGTNKGDSMVDSMNRLYRRINFKSPVLVSEYTGNSPLANYRIYTVEDVIEAYEVWMRNHNQDIGMDAGKYNGACVFKGLPLERHEILEEYEGGNADTPYGTTIAKKIYGVRPIQFVNWNEMFFFILKGNNMFEHDPIILPNQPNTVAVNLDHSTNLLCRNRRYQGVLIEQES
jgi:hypothetical protein